MLGSTWDHIFSDIKKTPSQVPHMHSHPGIGPRRPRRQTMTAQEISAFNEIFNLIFDSMSEQGSGHSASVDIGGAGMGDLFGTLRRHSKRMQQTAASDEDMDRKKDEMDRCETDQQLLEWAMREVFGESQSYAQQFASDVEANSEDLPMLQPSTYPHIISLLMRTFRDRYRDPHLALSIFDYARRLSIASYVFGCSTSAYNELITTRWTCFRDLKGVHDALEEMVVNGVDIDHHTRELVEKVRQEVGERHIRMEEVDTGAGGAWEMLNNIERLANQTVVARPKKQKKPNAWNGWRAKDLADNEFNKW
ncbi:hypothetical protein B0H15DRAFT_526669 [Mycena belliarum]|uniref:Mtf2-like C-terminal domain-containing protein n=1 Tax=Mycena belliarum TaxID=1033014 RepID=A0AAD6XJE8_9AGAR|nr:hypothetical protein B0H15DRAFT_526669 [Mycena belliae]